MKINLKWPLRQLNKDANKIVEQAECKMSMKESFNFLIDLATIVMIAKDKVTIEDKTKLFDEA